MATGATRKLTGWRKLANAMWDPPDDPQIYGLLEVDASGLLAFQQRLRAAGHHVTPTHVVGRALARALWEVPDMNVRIVGDRAIARKDVDIFFITAVESGRDLSGVKVRRLQEKSVTELVQELSSRAAKLKGGEDADLGRAKHLMEVLPRPALRLALRVSAWMANDRGWNVPALAVQESPFGSAMVTSVGMFGLPAGFAPLAWMYHVPLLVLVGEITDRPVAIDGRVEVRPVLPLTATIDHRYVDGAEIAKLLTVFRACLAEPGALEPGPARDDLPGS